jgi:hypothetical protein
MQGMNFLLARLRKVLTEEETFWTFVTIIEVYLPPEHYSSTSGIELDLMILTEIMKKYNILSEITQLLQAHDVDIRTTSIMGWFVSLFTWGVPEETSNCAIDILLLKGRHSSKLIFELGLAFLHLEREQILLRTN